MNDAQGHPGDEGLASLAIDPEVHARELEAELVGDTLDEIEIDDFDTDSLNTELYFKYKKTIATSLYNFISIGFIKIFPNPFSII